MSLYPHEWLLYLQPPRLRDTLDTISSMTANITGHLFPDRSSKQQKVGIPVACNGERVGNEGGVEEKYGMQVWSGPEVLWGSQCEVGPVTQESRGGGLLCVVPRGPGRSGPET